MEGGSEGDGYHPCFGYRKIIYINTYHIGGNITEHKFAKQLVTERSMYKKRKVRDKSTISSVK